MSTTLTKSERTSARPWFRRGTLQTLRDEMQDVFSNLMSEDGSLLPWAAYMPLLDMSETESTIEVRMDVPGVKPADIDIQMSGHTLTVSGKREEQKEEKGRTFHRMERSSGSFSRTVTLPCDVKEEAIDAKIQEGMLLITMQKAEDAKIRKIKIRT